MRRSYLYALSAVAVAGTGLAYFAYAKPLPPKAPDLTFYGPVIERCSDWLENKDVNKENVYNAAVLGELSGLENMCRLAKPGSLPFPCTGKKIQTAGQFVVSVKNTCKSNQTHTIAEVTFVVWKWIATHDLKVESKKK